MSEDLYICTTYYHVYVLLLKRLTGYQKKCDVVICDDIPTGEILSFNLQNSGLFDKVWYIRQLLLPEVGGKGRLDKIFFQHKRRYRLISHLLPFDINAYRDVYIFHDDTALGRFLNDAHKYYHLIEDSYNFFQRIKNTPQSVHIRKKNCKYVLAKILNLGYFPMGESKYVIDIEVNENSALQIDNKKIVELTRDGMRKRLSSDNKRLMRWIFGNPAIPNLDHCALLLTEPLFKDGVCNLERQCSIYRYVVHDLQDKGYLIVLKPHPRDDIDYSWLSVHVIERTYPIEILVDNLESELDCVAAVSSSAVYSMQAKAIYIYDNLIYGGKTNNV